LPPAYHALEALADVRFQGQEEKEKGEKISFFDRVLRKGILPGYFHTSEYPSIVEVLITQLSIFVSRMGIHSVKHLKVCPTPPLTLFSKIPCLTIVEIGYNPNFLNDSLRSFYSSVLIKRHRLCPFYAYPKCLAENR